MLNHPPDRLSQEQVGRSLHLVDVRGMVILLHHPGEIDGPEVGYEVLLRKETGILEDVESVGLLVPVEKSEWFFDRVKALVEERDLEHDGPKIEGLLFGVSKYKHTY